jgi:hypothetical protein
MKNKFLIAAIALALLVTWIGIRYRIPAIIALVLCGLAVFAFVTGVQMIVTRRAQIPTGGNRSHRKEYHTGLGAQLWGMMFILMSAFPGAVAFVFWRYGNEPPADLVTRLVASPLISGVVIVATGAGIVMYGLTRLIAGNAPFAETKLRPIERMLGGGYACIVGSLVVVAGLVRGLSPGTLTRLRDGAIASVLQLFR